MPIPLPRSDFDEDARLDELMHARAHTLNLQAQVVGKLLPGHTFGAGEEEHRDLVPVAVSGARSLLRFRRRARCLGPVVRQAGWFRWLVE